MKSKSNVPTEKSADPYSSHAAPSASHVGEGAPTVETLNVLYVVLWPS